METNWTNPKRLVAVFFFLVAGAFLISVFVSAFFGTGLHGSNFCTADEKASELEKCNEKNSDSIVGFLTGGLMGGICCLPPAIFFFILGAFFFSGAKKDDLRDLEIHAYHKGEKVNKKTESI